MSKENHSESSSCRKHPCASTPHPLGQTRRHLVLMAAFLFNPWIRQAKPRKAFFFKHTLDTWVLFDKEKGDWSGCKREKIVFVLHFWWWQQLGSMSWLLCIPAHGLSQQSDPEKRISGPILHGFLPANLTLKSLTNLVIWNNTHTHTNKWPKMWYKSC